MSPYYLLLIVKGDDREDPGQTKWSGGFDSQLVLSPLKLQEQQKRLLGFGSLLNNCVTLLLTGKHQTNKYSSILANTHYIKLYVLSVTQI